MNKFLGMFAFVCKQMEMVYSKALSYIASFNTIVKHG